MVGGRLVASRDSVINGAEAMHRVTAEESMEVEETVKEGEKL